MRVRWAGLDEMQVREDIAAPAGRGWVGASRLETIWKRLFAAGAFIRFSALGGTLILPLLGAASVGGRLPMGRMLGLLAVAVLFHAFAYVLNDVVDLPVDRTEPRRVLSPLVRGAVTPGQAVAFALGMVPPAFGLTLWSAAGARALVALATAFLCLAAYDLWGKRGAFPPLTDLIQGVGWAALLLGGAAAQGRWAALT